MENWSTEMKVFLETKILNFSEQEKENISYGYIINLLTKVENAVIFSNEELRSKVSFLITEIPFKTEGKALKYSTKHLNKISNLQTYVDEKFGLIPKGKYKRRYLTLGLSLGSTVFLPVGLALGNIALGIGIGLPIGIAFGIMYGNHLDSKAEQENKVL